MPITTKAPVLAWRELCLNTASPEQTKQLQYPIGILHSLIPDLPVLDWTHYGIQWVDHIMPDSNPIDPNTLLWKCNIPQNSFLL